MTPDDATRDWLAAQWAWRATEFRVENEGASLACRGWNLDADAPGIVLIHGFRAHARWWDHLAPSLAERHRVIAFDLSGMGDSDRRPGYSRAGYGREVLAVAAAAGIDRAILIAHSFGAIAAMNACRLAPDLVARLVVIDSALPTADEAGRAIPEPPLRTYPTREAAIERFRLLPPGEWPQPDLLAYVAAHSVRRLADGRWTWKFDNDAVASLNAEGDYRSVLLDLDVAADVIHGDRSELFDAARAAQVPLMLPRCGAPIAIPASHHHVLIEQPLALQAALLSLLANPKGASEHPNREPSAPVHKDR